MFQKWAYCQTQPLYTYLSISYRSKQSAMSNLVKSNRAQIHTLVAAALYSLMLSNFTLIYRVSGCANTFKERPLVCLYHARLLFSITFTFNITKLMLATPPPRLAHDKWATRATERSEKEAELYTYLSRSNRICICGNRIRYTFAWQRANQFIIEISIKI